MHHHALGEQAGERLVEADMAGGLHRAGEEARVEQVQDRVLDAADILVDRQPVVDHGAVGRRGRDPGIGEAREVPGRVRRTCPWCRSRAAPACRIAGSATFFQVGWRSSGLPGRSKRHVVRQRHRQVLGRHRHDAAGLAMDDRDRAAPVALARDAPVAQAVVDLALRHRPHCRAVALSSRFATSSFACRDGHAVEEARIDHACRRRHRPCR